MRLIINKALDEINDNTNIKIIEISSTDFLNNDLNYFVYKYQIPLIKFTDTGDIFNVKNFKINSSPSFAEAEVIIDNTDLELLANSNGGGGDDLPTGTNRQVIGFDSEGDPIAVTLGWRQLSDLPSPPPFKNGIYTGTAFQPNGNALFAFLELSIDENTPDSIAKPNAIPIYQAGIVGTGGGTLPVQDPEADLDAVNKRYLESIAVPYAGTTTSKPITGDLHLNGVIVSKTTTTSGGVTTTKEYDVDSMGTYSLIETTGGGANTRRQVENDVYNGFIHTVEIGANSKNLLATAELGVTSDTYYEDKEELDFPQVIDVLGEVQILSNSSGNINATHSKNQFIYKGTANGNYELPDPSENINKELMIINKSTFNLNVNGDIFEESDVATTLLDPGMSKYLISDGETWNKF